MRKPKLLDQRSARALLEEHGWTMTRCEELREAVVEAITLYLEGEEPAGIAPRSATTHVDEIRVLVSA